MIRILLLCCVMFLSAHGHAHDCEEANRCKTVKEQIRNIESRMRQGYTAAQGIKLDERLRKLRKKRRKVCR